MKRRNFLRGIGLGSAALSTPKIYSSIAEDKMEKPLKYDYGEIRSMEDTLSAEGLTMVRLEFWDYAAGIQESSGPDREMGKSPGPDREMGKIQERLRVRKGKPERTATYFGRKILVLWLRDASAETRISAGGGVGFTLQEVLERKEVRVPVDGGEVTANFLLDREIGEISLGQIGCRDPGEEFSFVAMADPQGGDPGVIDPRDRQQLKTRMKIHNAFIEESVALANSLDFDPLFTMVIGDICDDWGYEKDLRQMHVFLSRLNSPVLYGIGNHETLLQSTFGPGYNMEAFNNYLAAQKAMNGLDKLLYSFNAGRWHFVVWPDPLRDRFWETHPHYFDWLDRDLEKHSDRPTMIFQHVPVHPVGISPLINYCESVDVKRTFLEILSRRGNVKYVLSGHVHIPVKASFKTAVSCRGIRLINLPAAGYRPRAFGEGDYYGGPSQGIALVHIDGDRARIRYKTVTEEIFDYPDPLPAFDEEAYPLWLNHPWELPAESRVRNGDFSGGLDQWARRYVYREDTDPSNLCEVRPAPGLAGENALYLFCRRRGYLAPGQDRLPQDINRVCQAVDITGYDTPVIGFNYMIEGPGSDPRGFSGGFVWIEGYSGSTKVCNMMYSAGRIWVNIGGKYAQIREVPFIQMGLDSEPGSWHRVTLDIAGDYNRAEAERAAEPVSFGGLRTDRLVINLGVWNLNDGDEYPFGIYFTGFALEDKPGTTSSINGKALGPKPKEDEWWRGKIWPSVNIAGEHRYIISTSPEAE